MPQLRQTGINATDKCRPGDKNIGNFNPYCNLSLIPSLLEQSFPTLHQSQVYERFGTLKNNKETEDKTETTIKDLQNLLIEMQGASFDKLTDAQAIKAQELLDIVDEFNSMLKGKDQ